jgi:hypothetical protein
VTLQPIGQPSRILNDAYDTRLRHDRLLARDLGQVGTAFSRIFVFVAASPTPMLIVILLRRGTSIGFV